MGQRSVEREGAQAHHATQTHVTSHNIKTPFTFQNIKEEVSRVKTHSILCLYFEIDLSSDLTRIRPWLGEGSL